MNIGINQNLAFQAILALIAEAITTIATQLIQLGTVTTTQLPIPTTTSLSGPL